MQTAEFVAWLGKRVGGNLFSTQDLIDATNAAQNRILGRDIAFMRHKPDMWLHTTAGVYSYSAYSYLYDGMTNAVTNYDVRNVARLYTYNIRGNNLFAYQGLSRTTYRPERPLGNDLPDVEIDFDFVPSLDAGDNLGTIRLWPENDPGTTTEVIQAEVYTWPTQILTVNQNITLPDQFRKTLLYAAVLEELEYAEYGAADRPKKSFDEYLADFDTWSASLTTTAYNRTYPREC